MDKEFSNGQSGPVNRPLEQQYMPKIRRLIPLLSISIRMPVAEALIFCYCGPLSVMAEGPLLVGSSTVVANNAANPA